VVNHLNHILSSPFCINYFGVGCQVFALGQPQTTVFLPVFST
jgi:hypothetical protein